MKEKAKKLTTPVPCPFCKAEPDIQRNNDPDARVARLAKWSVVCENTRCSVVVSVVGSTIARATQTWNREMAKVPR